MKLVLLESVVLYCSVTVQRGARSTPAMRQTRRSRAKDKQCPEQNNPQLVSVKVTEGPVLEKAKLLKRNSGTVNTTDETAAKRMRLQEKIRKEKAARIREWEEKAVDNDRNKKFIFTAEWPESLANVLELKEGILKILSAPGGNSMNIITSKAGNYLIDPGALDISDYDLFLQFASFLPLDLQSGKIEQDPLTDEELDFLRNYSSNKSHWTNDKTREKCISYAKKYIACLTANLESDTFKSLILTSIERDNFSWITYFFPPINKRFKLESVIVHGSPKILSASLLETLKMLKEKYGSEIYLLSCSSQLYEFSREYISQLSVAPQLNFTGFSNGSPKYQVASTGKDHALPCQSFLFLKEVGLSLYFPVINHHHSVVLKDRYRLPIRKTPNVDAAMVVATVHARQDLYIDYNRLNFSVLFLGDATSDLQNHVKFLCEELNLNLGIDFLVLSHNGQHDIEYYSREFIEFINAKNIIIPTLTKYSLPAENFCNELLELTSTTSTLPHRIKQFHSTKTPVYKEVYKHVFTLHTPLYLTFINEICYLRQFVVPIFSLDELKRQGFED